MHNSMKRFVLQILIYLLCSTAWAVGTSDLIQNADAQEILHKKCIRLGTSEILPLKFETIRTVLNQADLVQNIQAEFIRSISENGEVDFPIQETAPGHYYYINEKGQRADIIELYRAQTDEFSFDYIVMAQGKRFFGSYDVIIHLQVVDVQQSGIVYTVKVYAYPHSWLLRTSHKLGMTRNFFKKKMKMISWITHDIATGLCKREELKTSLLPALPIVQASPLSPQEKR